MAIIYSYNTVKPTGTDLILGTDVSTADKATKNFTVQSIVDLIAGGATGLKAVLQAGNDAGQLNALDFGNVSGVNAATFGSFVTTGGVTISGTTGINFTNIISDDFTGDLTGIVKLGSSIAGTADGAEANNVLGVTQPVGTNNKTLATTAFVASRVDPSVLTFLGTNGNDQTVDLATQKFSILGTTNQIETDGSAQKLTIKFPTAGVTLPNGSVATTQLPADDSDKVATTKFVHDFSDAQDLDFSDGTTTSSVILGGPNAQVFKVEGTASQVTTSASGQTLTISLPNPVVRNLTGDVTGVLKAGSSIESTVTGVTQTQGNDSTRLATTEYVDAAAGAKTLSYQADAASAGTQPFSLNLSTQTFDVTGGSNISTTSTEVAGNVGILTVNLNDDVTITGKMQAGTLSDGTFSGSNGTYTGGVSITSALFVGPLTGNATTATSLALGGTIGFGNEVSLLSATPDATYTGGGNRVFNLTLNNDAVIGKVLTGLSVPATGSTIIAADSILTAFGKLQAQHNTAVTGLRFMGTWNADMDNGGTDNAPYGTPSLVPGSGQLVAGENKTSGTTLTDSNDIVFGSNNLAVVAGDRVYNQRGDFTTVATTPAAAATTLTLTDNIFLSVDQTYSIDNAAAPGATPPTAILNQGEYYVVSAVNATENRNATLGAGAGPAWSVGDWVIAGATNVWEKLDQTSVDGTGTINRIPRWDTVSSLNDSIILQDSAGIKIDTGKTLTTQGTGGNLTVGGAATITGLTTASAALSLTGGVNLPVGGYGAANQVLGNANAAGAVGTNLVWITPTVGEIVDVDPGNGITIDKTAPAEPVIAIKYDDTTPATPTNDNAILVATAATDPLLLTDQIWFNDISTAAASSTIINKIKKSPISGLNTLFDKYTSWFVNADDTDTKEAVTSGQEVLFTGTNGIITDHSLASGVHTVKIEGVADPVTGTGTALTLPVWEAGGTTLGDSMVSQDAATGTKLTISADDPILLLNDTSTGAGSLEILHKSSDQSAYTSSGSSVVGALTYGFHIFKQQQGTDTATLRTMLTLDADRTAKFNGDVSALSSRFISTSSATAKYLRLYAGSGTGQWDIYGDGGNLRIKDNLVGSAGILAVDSGATFGGNIGVTGTGVFTGDITAAVGTFKAPGAAASIINAFQAADGNNAATFRTTTTGYVFEIRSQNSGTIKIDTSLATFTGNVKIDGSIIHGGGGAGIFTGSKTINSSTAATAFTLQKSTGTLIFDVWLTSETSTATSVAKKYTVAHSYGTTPVYNKIIDTGPDGSNDFTVTFVNAGTGGDSVNCSIISNTIVGQAIGYTVQVGHDSTNTLTFTAG